jgi:uncharacterized protein (DUF427 family)
VPENVSDFVRQVTYGSAQGTAHYYSLHVGGTENTDATWYDPESNSAAEDIRARIAIWKVVIVG